MARIVVCGYMIRYPVAGMLFVFFHYLLGLARLGHDVLYLEESGWSQSCYNPVRQEYSDDPLPGFEIIHAVMAKFDLQIPICYVNRESGQSWGATWDDLKEMLKGADLLLNIGGVCWLPEFRLCHRRTLIDLDPFFTQIGRFAVEDLDEYQMYFSYGGNIGKSDCTVPTRGIDWHPTVPPVVPEIWQKRATVNEQPIVESITDAPFTTIANWNAYGGIAYAGEYYGQKSEEFLRLLNLPNHTAQRLELALSGASSEIQTQFLTEGWLIRDGGAVSVDLSTYQTYLINSRGEFSVAKQAYVKTRSGWFSDRSVCYLAAGRPAILQDTGFSDWLPTGQGVLAFSSLEEAVDCIDRVNRNYQAHCQAARELAEQFFSYKVVLPRLLETALTTNIPYISSFP
ncbi:hypothetical protein [Nostoc sp. DedQUE09]|uniref:hypothetical protein n=1 Tax=Nostoc sp. DedQUE09 TaxID=3075394 RepID=UPI002AD3F18C|nr:hypothetical protein [Nostoc sp. DedQUE09]MDZ7953090.1 hypothetical protein [Nostoc sp. DedQUE09]